MPLQMALLIEFTLMPQEDGRWLVCFNELLSLGLGVVTQFHNPDLTGSGLAADCSTWIFFFFFYSGFSVALFRDQ